MTPERARIARWALDVTVALACAVAGYCFYVGVIRGQTHVVNLGSDAGNIAGFIAATERPDLFARDEALGNPRNYAHYLTVQIPSAIFLSQWTKGDYGTAMLLPLPILEFIQLLGFYALGIAILGSRALGIVLAVLSLLIVPMPGFGEYWGVQGHATPREWFQALLPLVLLAAWTRRSDPRAWASVLFAMGLMMYVHPVSAPGWTVALWLGFLGSRPQDRSWGKHLTLLAACTPAFFVAAIPFILNYLGEHEHGVSKVPYEQVYAILKDRFAAGYLDLPNGIGLVAAAWSKNGVIPAGLLGGAIAWRLEPQERGSRRLLLIWLGGLLLMSTLVPVVEQAIAARLRMIPVEVDLVRGLRYVVPLAHIFALLGVASLMRRIAQPAQTAVAIVAAMIVLVLATSVAEPAESLIGGWHRLNAPAQPPKVSRRLKTLLAIRSSTPEGATILPSSNDDALPLRYFSRRPVVYAWKDGGILAYANHEALLRWYQREQEMKKIASLPEPGRTRALIAAGRRYDADYLLLDSAIEKPIAKEQHADIVLRNKAYTLLKL